VQAFIYCRVSGEEQANDNHYCLENQEKRGRDGQANIRAFRGAKMGSREESRVSQWNKRVHKDRRQLAQSQHLLSGVAECGVRGKSLIAHFGPAKKNGERFIFYFHRSSRTESLLRLNVEADSRDKIIAKAQELLTAIRGKPGDVQEIAPPLCWQDSTASAEPPGTFK
jgi:phosphomannomutase